MAFTWLSWVISILLGEAIFIVYYNYSLSLPKKSRDHWIVIKLISLLFGIVCMVAFIIALEHLLELLIFIGILIAIALLFWLNGKLARAIEKGKEHSKKKSGKGGGN